MAVLSRSRVRYNMSERVQTRGSIPGGVEETHRFGHSSPPTVTQKHVRSLQALLGVPRQPMQMSAKGLCWGVAPVLRQTFIAHRDIPAPTATTSGQRRDT